MKKYGIVICTYNKIERLLLTLKSYDYIYKNITKDLKITICNDGGVDVREYINKESFEMEITVFDLHHHGRANARNHGAFNTDCEILIFNDDDIIIDPECFKYQMYIHLKHPNVVVLGKYKQIYLTEKEIKKHLIYYDPNCYSNRAKEDMHEVATKDVIFAHKEFSHHWLCGTTGNFSISKKLFTNIGGFDTAFKGWGYEDIELSYRLSKSNILFYCNYMHSNFHIEHSRNRKNMLAEIKQNIVYFYKKHICPIDISLYWDFLIGKLSIKDFDKLTFDELSESSNSNDIIYYGLKQFGLQNLETLMIEQKE